MLDSQAKLDLVNDIVFTSRPRTRSAVPAPGVIDHRRKNLVVVKSNSHDHVSYYLRSVKAYRT